MTGSADDGSAEDSPGPDAAAISAAEATHSPGEHDGAPAECSFTRGEELHDAFVIEPTPMILSPEDGLPLAVDNGTLAIAPPFTEDTVVCIGDEREFVEIFDEESAGFRSGPAAYVIFRSMYDRDGSPNKRLVFPADRVVEKYGHRVVPLDSDESAILMKAHGSTAAGGASAPTYAAVRPIRERCKHYLRQVFNNSEQPNPTSPGHFVLYRLCSARRSNGGGMMSIMDEAVYACDIREPRHAPSEEKHLDAPDRKRLEERAHTEMVPLFGLKG